MQSYFIYFELMYLDPDCLRTFLAFADSGSLARAAAQVGRTASAVTAQMRRLEEMVGEPLLAAEGRGRVLTTAGQELVGHARRILDSHRQALLALRGGRSEGEIGIGATQDFAETGLPALLRLFAGTHPMVRINLRIGRSPELGQALAAGGLDVSVGLRGEPAADEVALVEEPTQWFAGSEGVRRGEGGVALALLDPPCGFRVLALTALERSGRPYRIAATSSSLAGLRAAVMAGLAVTLRTPRWAGSGVSAAPPWLDLPPTPPVTFSIRLRAGAPVPARRLAELLAEGLRGAA